MDKLKIRNSVIIVAAGRGQRAGGVKPKQWQTILGKRSLNGHFKVFDHPLINEIILVTDSIEEAKSFPNEVIIVKGGYERSQSVLNGLLMVSDNISNVLIHDAARPCVTSKLISSIIEGLAVFDCVIPILPVTDALWEIDRNKINLVKSLDRNLFKTTQKRLEKKFLKLTK